MARRLLVSADAKVCKRQHTAPCSDCPWARKSIAGWLGPHSISKWMEIVHSDARIECHTRKQENDVHWQCAGSAIYRRNVAKSPKDPGVLRLPANTTLVFTWNEFEAHHQGGKL